jgi:2-methylcitrate dehydratase PrpD
VPSLSRQLAAWVADLQYKDLPPEVVDRAKGVTLHGLSSALIGIGIQAGKDALALMKEEEAGGGGVGTVLVDGTKLTKGGTVFVNSELIFAGGKWDTFRMLTHPGCNILPTGLLAAELEGATGEEYITGIVAGYEVMERMAADFIPTVMGRGFHAGPVFGIFGAAVAAAKIMGLNPQQIHDTIALCANLASGNLEGTRSGGRLLREGAAVRNALLAIGLAKQGMPGGETVLEGDAGFYTAYTGNNRGKLKYAFQGPKTADLSRITEGLGQRWQFLETLYRIHSVSGYNIAHIDVTSAICRDNDIRPEDIDRIEAVVNWFETLYPSPEFPSPDRENRPSPGSTHYYSAYAAVERGFPPFKMGPEPSDPPAVRDLMQRVTLIPSKRQTLFGPKITVFTKDGKSYTRKATGREFIWDFEEEVRRIGVIAGGVPIPESQYWELVEACRKLDGLTRADELIKLTIPR